MTPQIIQKTLKGTLLKRKQLFIAIDHGLSFPILEGLEKPFDILKVISDHPEIDGLIASLGVFRQAKKLGIDLADKTRLVLVDYVALKEKDGVSYLDQREMIVKPEETEIVAPHCFKMFLNLYEDDKQLYRNCRDVERFTVYGANHGVNTLAEIMFYGNKAFADPATREAELMRGCRIAMELGADALKIPYIPNSNIVEEISNSLKLPIYMLGGQKNEDREAFKSQLREMSKQKIDGFMFGRNVWQSDDMEKTIEEILNIIAEE